MKKFLHKIQSLFKKPFQKDRSRAGISYGMDWAVILTSFFILLAIVVALHIYMFVQISRDEFFRAGENTSASEVKLDMAGLERVVSEYGKKEEKFLELRGKKPSLVDPSM